MYYYSSHKLTYPDSFTIINERGAECYAVHCKMSWGHQIKLYKKDDVMAIIDDKLTHFFFPCFEIKVNDEHIGIIKRKFSLKKPLYDIDYRGYYIRGSFLDDHYEIMVNNKVLAKLDTVKRGADMRQISILYGHEEVFILAFILTIDAINCLDE